jgi:adenosine deaminase
LRDQIVSALLRPGQLGVEPRSSVLEQHPRDHARRIGHGVDVMHEDDPFGLLAKLAQRNVLVKILLVSNAQILEVSGPAHPFPTYWAIGVPPALATDDEGVSRSTMTAQYQRAVESCALGHAEPKRLARQSVGYAFQPGASLWEQGAEACLWRSARTRRWAGNRRPQRAARSCKPASAPASNGAWSATLPPSRAATSPAI